MYKLKALEQERKPPKKLVNIRVTEEEVAQMKKLAKIYANGNLTAWIKYTALNYRPKASELK